MKRNPRIVTPITRRSFVRLAGAATGGLLLAACAPTEPTPDPVDSPAIPIPQTGEVRRGGRLRYGRSVTPDGAFDPALGVGIPLTFAQWVYEPLLDIDEDYANTIPRLAESWEPEAGGQQWVFHLRRDVQFHHGREFTADDVQHTFRRILDPDFGSPGRAVYQRILDIEKLDDHTVRFVLAGANADFPIQLCAFQGKIVPHDLTNQQIESEPRGTGPFRIDRYAHADRILFARNESYWAEGQPLVDELEVVIIPEPTTMANALVAGEVDIYGVTPREMVEQLQGTPGVQTLFAAPMSKHQLFMRLDQEPFTDDRVRQAFKLVGDRVAMTQISWGDLPARADDDNPVIPPSPFRVDTDMWAQDLDRARELLAEAGYADGLDITLWAINDAPGILESCLAYANWASSAGINVHVEGVPANRYYAENWLEVSFGTVEWSPRTTPDEQLRVAYSSDAPWNETRYSDEEFDRLLDEALGETDAERRTALYADLQNKLVEEGGQIIPYHYPEMAVARDIVQDFRQHPLHGMDPRRVWLAES